MSKQRMMQRRPDRDQIEAVPNPALSPSVRGFGPQPEAPAPLAGHSFSQVSVLAPQAKMTVNTPGDSFEQEADSVASKVMRAEEAEEVPGNETSHEEQGNGTSQEEQGNATTGETSSAEEETEQVQMKPQEGAISSLVQRAGEEEEELQMKPATGEVSSLVQRAGEEEEELQMKPMAGAAFTLLQRESEGGEEEEEQVQMKEDGGSSGKADVSGVVSQGLSGGGQSLDSQTRSFMEPRFGHDFSQVKIHTDSQASQSAEAVAARAYTVGGDIAFRSGQYEPGTSEGKRLLAHELTHVVQQGAAGKSVQSKLAKEQAED